MKLSILAVLVLTIGCTATPATPTSGTSPTASVAASIPPAPTLAISTPLPAIGDVPREIIDLLLDDAASRTSVPRDDLNVELAAAVTWSDSSLGCPREGEFYIQVLTEGYWVKIQAADETLDYHASTSIGEFVLCPEGSAVPPIEGGSAPGDGSQPDPTTRYY